jgi:hypothetical protein
VKVKLKFDKKAILDFLADNVEKIVFAAIAVCFLFFIYRAIGWERFDKKPQDLADEADKAATQIAQCNPKVDKTAVDIRKIIEAISVAVPVKPFESQTPWNPPVYDPLAKRGEPALHPVESVRAASGVGRFNSSGAAAGENQGNRWVVLTGLVDNDKYRKAFEECFKAAAKTTAKDFAPEFIGFQVQRAEVVDENQDPAALKWEKPYKSLETELSRYPTAGSSAVGMPEYDHSKLTFGLPSRADRNWRDEDEIVHPELRARATQAATAPDEKQAPGERKEGSTGETAGFSMGSSSSGTASPLANSARASSERREGREGEERRMTAVPGIARAGEKTSPYYLFRFFDHNVQPGKRYRYRVQLAITNPNYGQSPENVSKEVRERMNNKETWKEYLFSPWSQPSDVVTVPRDDRLLAVSVKPSPRNDGEPTAKIMAVHWDMKEGVEIAAEFDVQPGKLANFLGEKRPEAAAGPAPAAVGARREEGRREGGREEQGRSLLEAGRDAGRDAGRGARPRTPARPKPEANEPKVDYRTETLVLDLDGGSPLLGKNLTWPGKMLFLTPDGELEVRADVADQKAYKAAKSPPARDAVRPAAAPPVGPGREDKGAPRGGGGGGGH